MRRVAITGMGVVSSMGVGLGPFWDGLMASRSGTRRVSLSDPNLLSVQIAAEVPDFDPEKHLTGISIDMLDRFSQFALVAGSEAMRDACLTLEEHEHDRAGVSIGTGVGGATTQDVLYRRYYAEKIARAHPFSIPRTMNSAAASQVGMNYGLRGPGICVSTACASGGHSIGEAFEMIRVGRADVMLAGGADAPITAPVFKVWEAMRVLANPPDAATACRPFSRDRQGIVIGEGSGVLVLEDWERARKRGVRIHAELVGYGATADAGHITQPGIDAPAHAIKLALTEAGLRPDQIDYVNAHGTGTRLNDATETTILKRAFGEHAARLAISSTKSMHGHAMGASGAIELIATILGIERSVAPPTINYSEPDPECDLDYVPNEPREMRIGAAISNSFAFGGLNAVLAVRRAA
ncbi:MAG TPA: beta-ketoacyl-[acyl-carrier-protein] synthase family protein [Vicinamibacterales bacterium]